LWIRLQSSNRLGVSRKAGHSRITEGNYIIVFERHFKKKSTFTNKAVVFGNLEICNYSITITSSSIYFDTGASVSKNITVSTISVLLMKSMIFLLFVPTNETSVEMQ